MPIFYECDRCTACCRWPGDVRLAPGEAEGIAAHLGMTTDDFIQRWTRLNRLRTGLSLVEKPDGSCAFLDGNDCRIQPVKPAQCRRFPNLWNFPGFEQTCRAKPREVTAEEWRRRVEEACGEAPLSLADSVGREVIAEADRASTTDPTESAKLSPLP